MCFLVHEHTEALFLFHRRRKWDSDRRRDNPRPVSRKLRGGTQGQVSDTSWTWLWILLNLNSCDSSFRHTGIFPTKFWWWLRCSWRRAWQPTPIFFPGESHGQRGLVGCSPWGSPRVDNDWATKRRPQQHAAACAEVEAQRCSHGTYVLPDLKRVQDHLPLSNYYVKGS